MRIRRFIVAATIVVTVQAWTASPALAQGCILLRQTCPMFGTMAPADSNDRWNLTLTGRSSTADIHYNGTERQRQRETEQTYVVNRQNSITATITYQLSPRVALNASVPFIEASWGIPSPRSGGPAARANENANGLGDIIALARFSVFGIPSHQSRYRSWDIQIGGGVKIPTGNNEATDVFPDGNGNNNSERYVDISVHPGDGGWGAVLDLQGYKVMGRVTAFGSGTWLANPRNTGTASRGNLVTNLNPSNINTVSDQFVFRAGTTVQITHWLGASVAWRMEGVPRYDAWGRSDGFRRPGVEMYVEPGVSVVVGGRHAMSLMVPIGYYFNRFRNPYTGNRGDSTFPEFVTIATYSVRLSKPTKRTPIMTEPPEGTPSSEDRDKKGGGKQ